MPFFIPVNFDAAYPINQSGRLAEDQVRAITRAMKARKVTGLILLLCDLPMLLLFAAVMGSGDWEIQFNVQMIFLVMALISLAGALFGFMIWRKSNSLLPGIANLVVTKVIGEVQKFNHGVAYELPGPGGVGITHGLALRSGNVKINGVMYGVLPGKLYGEIVDGKKADFYVVSAPTPGFKSGMVVNCSN